MAKKSTTAGRPLVNLVNTNTNEPAAKTTADVNPKPMNLGTQKPTASTKK